MINRNDRRFYFVSLAVLLALSAYPIISGTRMVFLSALNGAIEPQDYAKYVVPYGPMCFAVIIFAACQPFLSKLGRIAFPAGLTGAFGIFIAAEQVIERIQVHTAGMSLVDAASLSIPGAPVLPSAAVDAWQASLCIVSPLTRGQTTAYASQDQYFYVMANNTYKIHYYLIALILIAMLCGLIYGAGRSLRGHDSSNTKPLILQGISTAALITLCVFANTTAFFRQAAAIQTPLASLLTCLFFIVLGTAVGVYTGSFLLRRGRRLGIVLPIFVSVTAVTLMYLGEAAMMEGDLYRFGTGWFFDGVPFIALAPADLLVILLSGAATWLILRTARQKENWPGKRTAALSLVICVLIAAAGIVFSAAGPNAEEKYDGSADDIIGCYAYDRCLYMNPLSSFMPFGDMPYVYGVGRGTLLIADTDTGTIQTLSAQYERTPVAADALSSGSDFAGSDLAAFRPPNLSQYKERWLRAVFSDAGRQYSLYQLDGEIWLVDIHGGRLWSIYKLQRTDKTALDDLEHALTVQDASEGLPQMTLKDVYKLARRGDDLTRRDFKGFNDRAAGTGFAILRYDIEGGCVLIIHCDTPESKPTYVRLSKQGYDPFDDALTVDIREGVAAVAAYLDPLHSLASLKIEDPHGGSLPRELIYEFDGYRYYLNTTRADSVYITFDNGERLPLKQALEERRTIIEDLVANGLYNVSMTPADNPLGGVFAILHHRHTFAFDGEAFYPSKSFMYVAYEDGITSYFDFAELADILSLHGQDEIADTLRQVLRTTPLPVIAGKAYITETGLAEAGIIVDVGWALSSHTPVDFQSYQG